MVHPDAGTVKRGSATCPLYKLNPFWVHMANHNPRDPKRSVQSTGPVWQFSLNRLLVFGLFTGVWAAVIRNSDDELSIAATVLWLVSAFCLMRGVSREHLLALLLCGIALALFLAWFLLPQVY